VVTNYLTVPTLDSAFIDLTRTGGQWQENGR